MSQKKKILAVDDNQVNRALLRKILEAEGYQILEAENGKIALDLLRGGETPPVSLVLLDITMPVMDGYAVLDEMTSSGMITRVPVIVTTGNEDESAESRCLERGASDYLKKPYNAGMVRHRVQSLLRLWDNAALINRLEIDTLTGLYTEESFCQHSEDILDEHPNDPYYFVYADVDDFKIVNARYGTVAGDELLKYLADHFRKAIGNDGICCRITGDKFVALIQKDADHIQAGIDTLQKEEFQNAPVRGFQIKFGIYPVKDRSISIIDMCDRARLAASTIKHQYRIYSAFYQDTMLAQALKEHQLADCMEEALQKKQFLVYLQPKHRTDNKAVAGAEALVRWNHPELGFIPPSDFIPLFERNGFVTRLDEYMLREVCQLLSRWLAEGITPVPVSVNISRADFALDDLPERIASDLNDFHIPHELIHLEVTESAYTDNPQQIIAAVSRLRDMGFLIEMDDFGTGYSSLNMLSELPIDILKLDILFMRSSKDRIKDGKRDILSFIISLSKWLHLSTVAEGVETQEEFDQLRSMGCDLIQGYYFSKPMPADAFPDYMEKHPAQSKTAKEQQPGELLPAASAAPAEEKPFALMVKDRKQTDKKSPSGLTEGQCSLGKC